MEHNAAQVGWRLVLGGNVELTRRVLPLISQSRTYSEAAKNYRSRYGHSPPQGFRKWFQFAQDNKVKNIDDVGAYFIDSVAINPY